MGRGSWVDLVVNRRLAGPLESSRRTIRDEEMYGLAAQLRRSAVSIPSNIAEGAGRNTSKELVQFLGIANGSRSELDTQLTIASRLGFISANSPMFGQLERVGQLLTALRRSVRSRVQGGKA